MSPMPEQRPRVDWYRLDRDDSGPVVTEGSIRSDYAEPGRSARVYQEWVPLWLLTERLWEEVEGKVYPDWDSYDPAGTYPPIKLEVNAVVRKSNSYVHELHIKDGNHRVRYWKEQGFQAAPAWVLDYRPGAAEGVLDA